MKRKTKVYVGMDVHKDAVTIAVLPEGAREATLVKRMSHDPRGRTPRSSRGCTGRESW